MIQRKCHKQEIFTRRIEGSLGVSVRPVSCYIVDQAKMTSIMQGAGWAAAQTQGVVGFQRGQNVYVLDSAPWTVLHELIHRSGVNADRLNRFVAEGLTEAIAEELRRSPDEHKPTYPQETAWVKQVLLPRLGMSAVQLGRRLAQSRDPVGALADLMVRAKPGTNRAALVAELRPQVHDAPSYNRGHVTRVNPGASPAVRLGGALILAGAVLVLPSLLGAKR